MPQRPLLGNHMHIKDSPLTKLGQRGDRNRKGCLEASRVKKIDRHNQMRDGRKDSENLFSLPKGDQRFSHTVRIVSVENPALKQLSALTEPASTSVNTSLTPSCCASWILARSNAV